MEGQKPSATAAGVTLLRVLHQRVDAEPLILRDAVSERLLDPRAVRWALANLERFQTPWSRGLRVHVMVRSRYSEDALAEAALRGVRQAVTIGAGLDTFAYRQPPWANAIRLYEVDHPASQAQKRERLAKAEIAVPANLAYVPIDFETETLRTGLERAGLDFGQPTFFSCLGVLMYLTGDAAGALLDFVGGFPAESELVFTFSPKGERTPGHEQLARVVAEAGEPLQTFFSEQELEQRLRTAGFHAVSFVAPETISARYLGLRTDGLVAPSRTTIGQARV